MRLLFASDSFKGSLSSEETIKLLTIAAKKVFGESAVCKGIPMADGGEGTADAAAAACGGEMIPAAVHNALGEPIEARFAALSGNEALLETAAACGLTQIPKEKRNLPAATSFGAGELLKAALGRGFRKISIAIGGSATNDGGMGFAIALGARFYDAAGNLMQGRGEDLGKLARIDLSALDPRISESDLTVLCDVSNPLCGENGATFVYGPQKGGSPKELERLEAGMEHYRAVIRRQFGIDPDRLPGAGAAGGLGAALQVFFGAKMRSGIEAMLELSRFDNALEQADLVVTGEGRCDRQSAFGKVIQGVAEHAKRAGVPAIAVCGSLGEGYEAIFDHGIESIETLVSEPMPLEEALARAEELYEKAAERAFRMVASGMKIRKL